MNLRVARAINYALFTAIRSTPELVPYTPELRHAPLLPRKSSYSPWLTDEAFQRAINAVRKHTLVDTLRCYELWSRAKQSAKLSGGALLEVGVWRGGTGCLIAAAAREAGIEDAVFLCDTFTGVVNAGAKDTAYKGGEHADTNVEVPQKLAASMTLPSVRVLKGIFPNDTAHLISNPFRFVHLDLDVYESTRQSLDFVWPRLVPGGIVVFDDYGTYGCEGVTRLVNEVAELPGRLFIYNANGHGVLIKC